ncbi:MAG: glycosyltransferase [Endomicrobia bacterium]|nr:glycosyltransferase [Endomicrobiia bacterium]
MKNTLEIILITYNRQAYLKDTLDSLFSAESPVKELDLTILDNASDDGTEELCRQYASKYSNIKYIKHPKNIGGNGNIARAFEIAKKEYVWIICDDDFYDWSAWPEMEAAINTKKYDVLLTVNKFPKDSEDLPKITKELCFLPGGIYKTSNITGGVLQNMYSNIQNLFPHLAAACAVVNKNGSFYVPKSELIPKRGADRTPCETLYHRDADETYKPDVITNMFWGVGYINSLQMIRDKKVRARIINNCSHSGFFSFIFTRFRDNKRYYNNDARNRSMVWCGLNFVQKIQFAFALLLIDIIYCYIPLSKIFKRK